ncbi:MAG: Uma2 family endonuclease [Oculatellaceae cyanobacterium Prado106]|jgi:Uma2 family endonuclease|nr:Uma2 family endonuclease [Oculatellaceae cyanobacterium Prado106]
MVQALQVPVSFDEFIAWLPESSECCYELHRGKIVEMPKPRGKHSKVAGVIQGELYLEVRRLQQPYFIPKECIVRSADGLSGYEPDVILFDEPALVDEPQWESGSLLSLGKSIKLIVEVVSSNWQDDYLTKLRDYEALSIQEYWIVDYAGLGGRQFIGNPKQPTFSVYTLVDGEYEVQRFRGGDRIFSPTFPALNLTVEQTFAV